MIYKFLVIQQFLASYYIGIIITGYYFSNRKIILHAQLNRLLRSKSCLLMSALRSLILCIDGVYMKKNESFTSQSFTYTRWFYSSDFPQKKNFRCIVFDGDHITHITNIQYAHIFNFLASELFFPSILSMYFDFYFIL